MACDDSDIDHGNGLDLRIGSSSDVGKKLLLSDVYTLAESVGAQFQNLIKQFGNAPMAAVVPIVVGAMEHLEKYVQENQRLELMNRKLMLQVDSLAGERDQRLRLTGDICDLNSKLEVEKEDKKRLTMRVDRLLLRNEDLAKELDRVKGTALKPVPVGEDPLALTPIQQVPSFSELFHQSSFSTGESTLDFHSHESVVDSNGPDRLQFTRVSRRLSQIECDLQKARQKLVEAHHSLQKVTAENRSLKARLEDSRAEAALSSFEIINPENDLSYSNKHESPRFFKEDLLAVLRERNEIKEELDGVREDFELAKSEIRRLQALVDNKASGYSLPNMSYSRPRSITRVREILDPVTDSIQGGGVIDFQAERDVDV